MAEGKYFSADKKFHEDLLNARAVFSRSFEGVEVFYIDRTVKKLNLNARTYYMDIDNYQKGENMASKTRKDFEVQIHNKANKKGICLHHTEGKLEGDLRALTGERGFVSVPFVISRPGMIYQLLDPDMELSWHLGSKIAEYWYHHNQIIGIELSNMGQCDSPNTPGFETVTLPVSFRGTPVQ